MMAEKRVDEGMRSFPRTFWIANILELFERGAYYGMMSVLAVYLRMKTADGGLGFSETSVGFLQSIMLTLTYVMDRPRLLWAIFSAIGILTVIGLLIYDRYLSPEGSDMQHEKT